MLLTATECEQALSSGLSGPVKDTPLCAEAFKRFSSSFGKQLTTLCWTPFHSQGTVSSISSAMTFSLFSCGAVCKKQVYFTHKLIFIKTSYRCQKVSISHILKSMLRSMCELSVKRKWKNEMGDWVGFQVSSNFSVKLFSVSGLTEVNWSESWDGLNMS